MVSFISPPAAADCTCRALGRDFELGRVVCLSTPNGPRLATCGMVLNNTSWRISDTPCVTTHGNVERVSRPTITPSGTVNSVYSSRPLPVVVTFKVTSAAHITKPSDHRTPSQSTDLPSR